MKSGKRIFESYFNDESLIKRLDLFYALHREANINLTSIRDYDEFYIKHYLDSLYVFKKCSFKFDSLMDIGSGGGFPGIPIAMLYPEKRIYLVESIKKKAEFLKEASNILDLKNVVILNERCENIKDINVNIITARGVAKIEKILKWTKNVSRETLCYILYKGEKWKDEIEESKKIIDKKRLKVSHVRVEEPFKRSYVILYNFGNNCMCPDTAETGF